jgi:hypothetical protein
MTDQNLTEIICVIDRSGSMGSIRDDAIGGFNTFLNVSKGVSLYRATKCSDDLVVEDAVSKDKS